MKTIELVLDENVDGVFAISFVNEPAIESNFIALSKEYIQLRVSNEEKRIVTGAILIPDKPILRKDDDGNPYNIFFSKETVEKLSHKYLQDFNQKEVTIEHEVDAEDIVMVESWIKTDEVKDKSIALGIDAPVGSWIGSFKVNNDDVWNGLVKNGLVKGFSVEAVLKPKEVINNSKQMDNEQLEKKSIMDTIRDTIKETFNSIKDAPVVDLTEEQPEVKDELQEAPVDRIGVLEEQIAELKTAIENLITIISEKEAPAEEEEMKKEETEPVEAAKVEEEPKMITPTDDVEEFSAVKKTKFNRKLTVEERIKERLGLL